MAVTRKKSTSAATSAASGATSRKNAPAHRVLPKRLKKPAGNAPPRANAMNKLASAAFLMSRGRNHWLRVAAEETRRLDAFKHALRTTALSGAMRNKAVQHVRASEMAIRRVLALANAARH